MMKLIKLLLLLLISNIAWAEEAEYQIATQILSIPTVKLGDSRLYNARLKLNSAGLFAIVSYDETSGKQLTATPNDDLLTLDQPLLMSGVGKVTRILADDLEGSQHQKFILELSSGDTLLISHNIDLAPRIDSLKQGDLVGFYGEYVWNSKGGLVHWTHHDPDGQHEEGWLKHNNMIYQ